MGCGGSTQKKKGRPGKKAEEEPPGEAKKKDAAAPENQHNENVKQDVDNAQNKESKAEDDKNKKEKEKEKVEAPLPLFDTTRAERDEGKAILDELRALAKSHEPRERDATLVSAVMSGNLQVEIKNEGRNVVSVFTSSTFTDTEKERNALMHDVYPFLRECCKILGWSAFNIVDMRWGVREGTGDDHGTSALCMREVARCNETSAVVSFVTFQSHKYGYRPLPASIPQPVLDKLVPAIPDGSVVDLLKTWYVLDENAAEPAYRLQRISKILPGYISKDNHKRKAASATWWDVFAQCSHALRTAARNVYPEGAKEAAPFVIAVTHEEVLNGLINNPDRAKQALCFMRQLRGIDDAVGVDGAVRGFLDMTNEKEADADAQALLADLKSQIRDAVPAENVFDFPVAWSPSGIDLHLEEHRQHVLHMCNVFTNAFVLKMKDAFMEQNVVEDALFDEVMMHRKTLLAKSATFVGRGPLVEQVASAVRRGMQFTPADEDAGSAPPTFPVVVHGASGSGKTSVLAKAVADEVSKDTSGGKPVVVVRFLGTSPMSGDIRSLLSSLCQQIQRAYGKTDEDVPSDVRELPVYFESLLHVATEAGRPLVIVLDSLDQLSDQDRGRELRWLPTRLPLNVTLIVSTLPKLGGCFARLQKMALACNAPISQRFVEVRKLDEADVTEILQAMVHKRGRRLTPEQQTLCEQAVLKTPSPLFAALVADAAASFRSYTEPHVCRERLTDSVETMIDKDFARLESIHGKHFVQTAFGLITVARFGLSPTEVEDLVSCSDEVLDDIFEWWTPPVRRLPPSLWVRLANDIPQLVLRGADGMPVYSWYHRQFWEAAERRFLSDKATRKRLCQMLTNYFSGAYNEGVKHNGQLHSRQIAQQHLRDPQTGQVNNRVLSELVPAAFGAKDMAVLKKTLVNLEFVQAFFEEKRHFELLSFYQDATDHIHHSLTGLADNKLRKKIGTFASFIRTKSHILAKEPAAVLQVGLMQADTSPVFKSALAHVNMLPAEQRALYFTWKNKPRGQDPNVLTIKGQTVSATKCLFSTDGIRILTQTEHAALQVWDKDNGDELATVNLAGGEQGDDDDLEILDQVTGKDLTSNKVFRAMADERQVGRAQQVLEKHQVQVVVGDAVVTVRSAKEGEEKVLGEIVHSRGIGDWAIASDLSRGVSVDLSYATNVAVWALPSGKELMRLQGNPWGCTGVDILNVTNSEGRHMFYQLLISSHTTYQADEVRLFTLAPPEEMQVPLASTEVYALSVSKDQKHLVAGADGFVAERDNVFVYNVAKNKVVASAHLPGSVKDAVFLNDDAYIFAVTCDARGMLGFGTGYLLDAKTLKIVNTDDGGNFWNRYGSNALQAHPGNGMLYASMDGHVKRTILHVDTEKKAEFTIAARADDVNVGTLAVSDDGTLLLNAQGLQAHGTENNVHVYDAQTLEAKPFESFPGFCAWSLAIAHDNSAFTCASYTGQVGVFSLPTGAEISQFSVKSHRDLPPGTLTTVSCMAFAQDNKTFFTTGWHYLIERFDLQGHMLHTIHLDAPVLNMVQYPQQFAVTCSDGKLYCFEEMPLGPPEQKETKEEEEKENGNGNGNEE